MGDWFAGLSHDLATEPAPVQPWWLCPNDPPCGHGAVLHDVEEYTGDGTDTCCAEGCDCQGPGA